LNTYSECLTLDARYWNTHSLHWLIILLWLLSTCCYLQLYGILIVDVGPVICQSVCVQSKFLSLELLNRRVRFVWDLGAGSTPIEYPLEIESAEGKADESDKWYRVVAERFLPCCC